MTTLSIPGRNGTGADPAKPKRYDDKCDYCGGAVKAFEGVLVYGDRRRWVPAHRSVGCHEYVIRSYNGSTVTPKARMWRDEVSRWSSTLEYRAWSERREELRKRRADALAGRPCPSPSARASSGLALLLFFRQPRRWAAATVDTRRKQRRRTRQDGCTANGIKSQSPSTRGFLPPFLQPPPRSFGVPGVTAGNDCHTDWGYSWCEHATTPRRRPHPQPSCGRGEARPGDIPPRPTPRPLGR